MIQDIKKIVEKRWWWLVGLPVLAGVLLQLTGYNYGFPYVEQGDEVWIFTNAFMLRKGEELGQEPDMPGYPPALVELNRALQPLAERVTGRPALLDAWVTIGYIRFITALLNGVTALLLAYAAYRLSGRAAALLAVAAWFGLPSVVQNTVIALTEGFQAFCYVLAFVLAVSALERQQRRAAVGSVLAGIGAVLFKYSALPALGFGVGTVLWLLWRGNWRKWLKVLLIQAVLIAATGFYILGNVVVLFDSGHAESQSFLARQNLMSYLNLASQWHTQSEMARLMGLAALIVVSLLIIGSLLHARRGTWRGIAWGLLLIVAQAHLFLIIQYVSFIDLLYRYCMSVMGLMILLVALAVAEIGGWLARRSQQAWLTWGLPLVFGLVWLLPIIPQTLALVYERTLPDTRAGMAEWSLNVLTTEYNNILAETVPMGRVFSRDRGGYRGLWQFYYERDFGSRSLQAWRAEGHQYIIGTPAYFTAAFARQPDSEAQMLLLKQFPPPDTTHLWRGPTLRFYRLWRPQHATSHPFGEAITLVGYDWQQTDTAITITPYWQAAQLPAANYNVYIHLYPLDRREIVTQADGIPAFNRLTRTWADPSETLIGTTFTLIVPAEAAGQYRVVIGLYDVETGARLLTETGEDFIELQRITVSDS